MPNSKPQSSLQKVEDKRHEEYMQKCTDYNSQMAEVCRHLVRSAMIENQDRALYNNLGLYHPELTDNKQYGIHI